MSGRTYAWKAGRHYPVDAQTFGRWLEGLPDQRPDTVVKAAANPKSPAHKLFEWDKTRAAHEFRLLQARVLFGSLVVDVVVYKRGKPETHNVQAVVMTSTDGDYERIDVAFQEPGKRDFVLSRALAQLKTLRRRYASLSELAVVFAAIDKVAAKPKRRRA